MRQGKSEVLTFAIGVAIASLIVFVVLGSITIAGPRPLPGAYWK